MILYLRIGVAGFAFGNVMLFSIPRYANGAALEPAFQRLFDGLNVLFALPVLFYSAAPYFRGAWASVRARAVSLDVPVALGLLVLFARSVTDIAMGWGEGFLDSFAGLVFFLLIGRLFQQKAFDGIAFERTARSFFPLSVRVERPSSPDGRSPESVALSITAIERIRPGDVMVIRPHEVVPADAVLLDDQAAIDYAFVSGEATPALVERGRPVYAGGRVIANTARLAATREVSHSRLAELWNHPIFAKRKSDWLSGLTAAFGFWFVVLALGLAAAGALAWRSDLRMAAHVATAVLIIACPCALTLAAPITLGTGMGVLGRAGCYLKSTAVALELSRIDTIVFDKTGTLTSSAAEGAVACEGLSADEWRLARRLAGESVHPISRVLAGRDAVPGAAADVREQPGQGIAGTVDGHRVAIGTAGFVGRSSGAGSAGTSRPAPGNGLPASVDEGTWVSVDEAIGQVRVISPERPGLSDALRALGRRHELWLLSGDRETGGTQWHPVFGSRMQFRQSPEDKLAMVRELRASGRRVLMIGDGLNDAGALAAADVGMAVSDDTACFVPACDSVIAGEGLSRLPILLRYARLGRRVIGTCVAVSVAYNVAGLALALAGRLTPLMTAILMPVSSLTIVGLSVGLMRRGGRQLLRAAGAKPPGQV